MKTNIRITSLTFLLLFIISNESQCQDKGSMFTRNRNSVYIENLVILPSINYDRVFPISKKTGVLIKVGLSTYADRFFTSEASFIMGGEKHNFDIGFGYDYGAKIVGVYGRLGYRYISKKGLLLKGGLNIIKNVPVFPTIGIGYSF
jgi:hypothetical protein